MPDLSNLAQTAVHEVGSIDPSDTRRFGGKATGLARMVAAGIPVPPAFVIGTDVFHEYNHNGKRLPPSLIAQIEDALNDLGRRVGRKFAAADGQPLLVSVRSGSQVSMPGMMDTVLNLGLDACSAKAMAEETGNRAFVIDTWMRFWKMYAEIVLGLDGEELGEEIEAVHQAAKVGDATFEALEAAVVAFIAAHVDTPPTDPRQQLEQVIAAVFSSWDSPRAKAYRQHQGIADDLGTAVTVQAMVFGNVDAESGSGVAFSRNPNDGNPALYGEYLAGRQGEDIVSGQMTPVDLSNAGSDYADLRGALEDYSRVLETLYGDAVDIEFTVEAGTLYLLQVRPAKRTAKAAIRIAADLIDEGKSPEQAVQSVSAAQVRKLLRPVFDRTALAAVAQVGRGIGSSPGHASGIAILDADSAADRAAAGERVLLVRPTTSPLDIRGMLAADGIVTAKGGALSHAAVVSRALDKPCVVGCDGLQIDEETRTFMIGPHSFEEGDWLAIDGGTGDVFGGQIALVSMSGDEQYLARLLQQADRLSGAELWIPDERAPTASTGIAGIGVIGLTDLAIGRGLLAKWTGAMLDVEALGSELTSIAHDAVQAFLAEPRDLPVQLRLPCLVSERARALVEGWSSLDPRLFLPLGHLSFTRRLLKGIAEATAGSSTAVTVLLSGITTGAEWQEFAKIVQDFPALRAGFVIQNMAGLEVAAGMSDVGATMWIDLDALLKSANGLLPEPALSNSIVRDYARDGLIDDGASMIARPFLSGLLDALAARASQGAMIGVDCAKSEDLALVEALYRKGFRRFSVSTGQSEVVRLILGQKAVT